MKRETPGHPRNLSLGFFALSALLIAALWILFVGGTRRNEMLVGAGVLVLSGMFWYQVWRVETLIFDFHLEDIVQGWRTPWDILTRVSQIVGILLKELLGIRRAGSFYRVSGFKTSKSEPRQVARRVLATFYTTMAPNFIVIGIDFRQSRMLFHQLERGTVPQTIKALGAQPGADRP